MAPQRNLRLAARLRNREATQPRIVSDMKQSAAVTVRAFVIELVVYTALVVAYFFAVLHFLGDWLFQLQQHHRYTYAGVAILLIIGQAVVLQNVTTFLLRIIRARTR